MILMLIVSPVVKARQIRSNLRFPEPGYFSTALSREARPTVVGPRSSQEPIAELLHKQRLRLEAAFAPQALCRARSLPARRALVELLAPGLSRQNPISPADTQQYRAQRYNSACPDSPEAPR